jgi:hypothetical protein
VTSLKTATKRVRAPTQLNPTRMSRRRKVRQRVALILMKIKLPILPPHLLRELRKIKKSQMKLKKVRNKRILKNKKKKLLTNQRLKNLLPKRKSHLKPNQRLLLISQKRLNRPEKFSWTLN